MAFLDDHEFYKLLFLSTGIKINLSYRSLICLDDVRLEEKRITIE